MISEKTSTKIDLIIPTIKNVSIPKKATVMKKKIKEKRKHIYREKDI